MDKKLIKKLKTASWVCCECGDKYGSYPENHISTWHYDTCDVCGKHEPVTEPRDFRYFRKTLENS